jgi:hypothetical protein
MMISEKPRFLSAEDVVRGRELKKELARLIARHRSMGTSALYDRKRELTAAYLTKPNEESVAKLQKECAEIDFLLANRKVRPKLGDHIDSFVCLEIIPFLRPLLEHGLELARRALANISEVENQRSVELTGAPTTFSNVIEAARRPVSWFEMSLRRLEPSNPLTRNSIGEILEALPEMLVTDSSNGADSA